MKRREYILLSAALLIAFTSCDKSNPEFVNESDKIDFVATPFHESFIQANQARGSETRNDNIQDFGVYAYYTADVFNPVSSTPNFMCNTQVRKTSNQWTYEPLMFWPNSGILSFFAYSPYANQGDSYTSLSSTPSTEGYPQLAYTVPDDVTKQRDLLVSVPLIDQTKADVPAGEKLTLAFKHTLACVVFQAQMTAARELPVKVTSITFGQLKNKADFAYGDTPGTFSWTVTADATDKSYTLAIDNNLLENTDISTTASDYLSISPADSHLLLLPQGIDAGDEITVTVVYTLAAGETKTVTKTAPLSDLIKNELEAGKRYSINILVSALADVTLTCSVEEWTPKTVNMPDFK